MYRYIIAHLPFNKKKNVFHKVYVLVKWFLVAPRSRSNASLDYSNVRPIAFDSTILNANLSRKASRDSIRNVYKVKTVRHGLNRGGFPI